MTDFICDDIFYPVYYILIYKIGVGDIYVIISLLLIPVLIFFIIKRFWRPVKKFNLKQDIILIAIGITTIVNIYFLMSMEVTGLCALWVY